MTNASVDRLRAAELADDRPVLSIVIPFLNEQVHLEELHERLVKVLAPITERYELLFVDDGSTDRSVACVEALAAHHDNIRLIEFSRNFGKEMAMMAGYEHARGHAVIVIDSDLQTPPEVLPSMIEKWRRGADVVDAVRKDTEGLGYFRRLASKLFYAFLRKMANIEMVPHAVDFRLVDENVAAQLRRCRERFRFTRGLVSWVGFRRESVQFVADERRDGGSRWSLVGLALYAMDAVFAFSSIPLRLAGLFGLSISFLSLAYLAFLFFYRVFIGQPTEGYATIVGGIFLLGGVQLLTIWLMGEYVGRLYEEVKGRPLFIISRLREPEELRKATQARAVNAEECEPAKKLEATTAERGI